MVTQDEEQGLMMAGLKTYFHDCFLSTEQLGMAAAQTGEITTGLGQLIISTGVQQASTARVNYQRKIFNPLYSKLYFKMRLNSMDDVFMFAGLTTTLDEPEWTKALPTPDWAKHSHTGLMVKDGTLYFVTGSAYVPPVVPPPAWATPVQVTPIADIDMRRWLVFRIEGDRFSWYSLPYTVPYFDKDVLPGLKQGMIRKWSAVYTNGSARPDDTAHYMVFFVKNTTGHTKYMEIQKINYAEVYPD